MDVDKHYLRKEYLLFPYLEKGGVTGPPKVMWGKHDEIRDLLKGSLEVLKTPGITREELLASTEIVLRPAVKGVADMIVKEEEILFPMLMDALTDADWYEIQKQSLEFGYCLYDPPAEWAPSGAWRPPAWRPSSSRRAGSSCPPAASPCRTCWPF